MFMFHIKALCFYPVSRYNVCSMLQARVIELTDYMAGQNKILHKSIKDLDEVRIAMNALASVKENYIRMDQEMIPIEVSNFYLIACICRSVQYVCKFRGISVYVLRCVFV